MYIVDYAINILCAPYAQPYVVHFFLGPVPQGLSYEQYSSAPSWVGQQYIMPQKPFAEAPRLRDYGTPWKALDRVSDQSDPMIVHDASSAVAMAQPLPDDYFKGAVRYSFPLSRALNKHLAGTPAEPSSRNVCSFLEKNLQWRVVRPLRGEIDDARYRLWVTRTEVTDPPSREPPQIVWAATRGKKGGLQQGELPQVEPRPR